jgi:SAM-dependent methyltransferase
MCNQSCLSFGHDNLAPADIRGKSVIEVGSRNINGSLRAFIESLSPASYLGVDMVDGDGVDEVCEAGRLVERFGANSFDLLISTEMLEHVHDWQRVIDNFKQLLRPEGVLLITTRSKGFPYHEAPWDFWRYEVSDMREIFADFVIENLQSDPEEPGVFLKARKPLDYTANDLSGIRLYSMVTRTPEHSVDPPAAIVYEGKLVRREGDTPEDGKVYVVRQGSKHWIVNAGWVSENGYRWPEDINVIPAGVLEQIPPGDPIH